MDRSLTLDWTESKQENFSQKPLKFKHNAHLSSLFSDDDLATLLEQSPRENYYINTVETDATGGKKRREGQIGELSGADVLKAVRKGHIWILLLYPEKVDPRYQDLLDKIYGNIEDNMPGLDIKKKKISVLISSPNVQVLYHCDLAGQTLWQVRGEKTVYVYPNEKPFLQQNNLEKIILNEAHEISLPYDKKWDDSANVYTIKPGDMLHWPLYAPHRIENGNCVNVSFTTEHVTADVRRNYAVNYGNGILRRIAKRDNLSQKAAGVNYWSKLAIAGVSRVLGLQKKRNQVFKVDFTVDPDAPRGYRDITPYEFTK